MQIIACEWEADPSPFPGYADFDPWGGDLDAQTASQNFRGLTRPQAYEKFIDHPEYYSEDFMFMGGAAFAYYYPVIERYLLEFGFPENQQAWFLAHCIKQQFDADANSIQHLRPRILALLAHVQSHLPFYGEDEQEQSNIGMAWGELALRLATIGT